MAARQRRVMTEMRMHPEAVRAGMREGRMPDATMRSESCMAEVPRTKAAAMKAMKPTAESSTVKPAPEPTAMKSTARSGQRRSGRGQQDHGGRCGAAR